MLVWPPSGRCTGSGNLRNGCRICSPAGRWWGAGWSRGVAVRTGGSVRCSRATGLLWFVGNFDTSELAALAWVAAHGVYLHRGPLVHVIVTYPSG